MAGEKRVYIDHNATTPMRPEVVEAMLPYMRQDFGNASSVHRFGQSAQKGLEGSREKMAELLRADDPGEIVFTSGGTEADNLAVTGAAFALRKKGDHIITSSIEHHAVYNVCKYLEKHHGFKVTYLPVDAYGRVDPGKLSSSITDATILVSVMMANNEMGTVQPVAELGKICRERSIAFHTDAVQAGGKLPIDVKRLNVDMLSLSAHKFYGPKGVGVLYIRKGKRVIPLFHGGHHERNRRAGTENVPGIVGMARAAECAWREMDRENKKLGALRDKLQAALVEKVPFARVNGHPEHRLSNTLNISFEFIEGEGIILSLDMKGVAVSTGSACSSGTLEPSHVLSALGVPVDIAHGSVRFSLGRDNTDKDIEYVIQTVPGAIERLRAMSPLWEDKQKGIKTTFGAEDHEHHHHHHDE